MTPLYLAIFAVCQVIVAGEQIRSANLKAEIQKVQISTNYSWRGHLVELVENHFPVLIDIGVKLIQSAKAGVQFLCVLSRLFHQKHALFGSNLLNPKAMSFCFNILILFQ